MAKLRLVAWMGMTAIGALVLLRGMTWQPEDPVLVVMAAVRVIAGVLAAYLFLVTLLAVRLPRLAPRFVARLVAGALGTGLLVAPLAASADPRPRPPAEAPILRRVADEPRSRDRSVPDVARSGSENEQEVVVAPGDHLWSISERELTTRLGRAPSDAEVVPFWTQVIELNRDRLATGDADLVFPGQSFRLPT